MNRYLASDVARLRRVLGTRAGSVYVGGIALLVTYLLLSVPLGPASLGGPDPVTTLLWLAFPVACLLVVAGGWLMRRNWLAWSIKRNLLLELLVLAPIVLWWTVVGRPETFSFAANPLVTVFVMTFAALVLTLLLSVAVLAVRVLTGFVRGHPDDENDEGTASTPESPDTAGSADTAATADTAASDDDG